MMTNHLNDITEVRQQLGGLSRTTLYDLFGKGVLVPVKIGRRVFVPQDEIDRYIESLSAPKTGQEAS